MPTVLVPTLDPTLALVFAFGSLAALVVYGLLAWERMVRRRREHLADEAGEGPGRTARPATTPDRAQAFAPVSAWVVVRASDPQPVVRALGLRTVLPANWASGLAEVRQAGVFVTPAIDGWVLAVGADLRAERGDVGAFVLPLLQRLGAAFGGAAWFLTDPGGERHGWALATRREVVRGYAYDGEHGHVFWLGDVTDAERELDCFVDDPRDQTDDAVKWWPDQLHVLGLAAAWSIDPRRLPERARGASAGWVGRL